MHIVNVMCAVADLALSPQRSFSLDALYAVLVECVAYSVFIQVTKLVGGDYPYPFLNEGPMVRRLVLFTVLTVVMTGT